MAMVKKTVKDLMVHYKIFIKPVTTLQEAARVMRDADIAVLPVGSPERLEGIITDRDLVIRAIINGDHAGKPVGDYMDQQVIFCYEDDSLEEAYDKMDEHKLHRLIIKDSKDNVVGILSLMDILKNGVPKRVKRPHPSPENHDRI